MIKKNLIGLLAFASLTLGTSAMPASTQPKDKVIADSWYTITVGANVHYGYYNDRIELKQGRLYFLNQVWKNEENFLNQEQLGAFAENNDDLTPLFYNFHAVYRTTEIKIDATVKNGKSLSVRVKKGEQERPIIQRGIPSKSIFSTFFPLWLGKRLASMAPSKRLRFTAMLEDSIDRGFNPVTGSVVLEEPDSFTQKTGTRKLLVDYNGQKNTWYVDSRGIPLRMEIHQQSAVVEKVSKEKAEKFLNVP